MNNISFWKMVTLVFKITSIIRSNPTVKTKVLIEYTVEAAESNHFGPNQNDNIDTIITITDEIYLVIFRKRDFF
jgi:hypothetical protein